MKASTAHATSTSGAWALSFMNLWKKSAKGSLSCCLRRRRSLVVTEGLLKVLKLSRNLVFKCSQLKMELGVSLVNQLRVMPSHAKTIDFASMTSSPPAKAIAVS